MPTFTRTLPATSNRVMDCFLVLECRERDGLVSLVDLRPLAGLTRDEFDSQLLALRLSDTLVPVGAEGRHGVTQQEVDAAVKEHGELLLYFVRR